MKTKSKKQVLKDASARNKMGGQKERTMKMAILVTEEMMLEHDGKQVGGCSNHWIYLTNLKAYNEGYLLGVYLHLPFSHEDLEMAYNKILVGNEFIDELGCSYEEYFISDYDVPFTINEYDYPQALSEKYDSLSDYMSYPDEVVRCIADNMGKEINIIDLCEKNNLSEYERLGCSLVELGYYEIPEHLLNYVDYELMGRDFALNITGEFASNYFLEFI
ncbi:antirestriction protein ArdA [Enterococcus sp. DIV0660C]|uniref:antirestriction protein ArdA n=1 Tax=Enterococcus sp. DIV0660C TaxID=2230880 RepID=UPI001F5C19AD|nr:antirestriction protein ArdA [Enterococcus sp. DIV0660C]